jgi:hypothetical protein
MKEKIGAYCTIRWNDDGNEVSGVLFSLEMYNEDIHGTVSGIKDIDVFYYADSEEQLLSMVDPAKTEGDFALLSIDDWVTNG